jgi:hypothetical protein
MCEVTNVCLNRYFFFYEAQIINHTFLGNSRDSNLPCIKITIHKKNIELVELFMI